MAIKSHLKKSVRAAAGARAGAKLGKPVVEAEASSRNHAVKAAPSATHVTTIRLDESMQQGLRLLEAHSGARRPLNKWINMALEEFIARQTAAIANELEQALRNINAYRKTDPGYKRALKAFIDSEVEFAAHDPMEGTRDSRASGPAVSLVRELLRG